MTDDQHSDLPLWQRLGENNTSDAALFREFGDIPTLVRTIRRPASNEGAKSDEGKSYEEAKWAHLSPAFRSAHNRLRRMRGQSPIPEPEVDLYVPRPPAIRRFDPNDAEVKAAARAFIGPTLMGVRGGEGFTINGQAVDAPLPIRSGQVGVHPQPSPHKGDGGGEGDELFPGSQFPGSRDGEGFTINGARVRGAVVRR